MTPTNSTTIPKVAIALLAVLLCGSLVLPDSAVAQGKASYCLGPDDSTAAYIVSTIARYATATDSGTMMARDSLGIPAVADSSAVQLVTKDPTCHRANRLYQDAVTGDKTTLTGHVYVVSIASSAYVVWDPGYTYNRAYPKGVYMVFDAHWKRQSIF